MNNVTAQSCCLSFSQQITHVYAVPSVRRVRQTGGQWLSQAGSVDKRQQQKLFELILLRNLGRLGKLPSRDNQLNREMREGAKLTLYLPVVPETTEGNIRTVWEDCMTVKRLDGKRRGWTGNKIKSSGNWNKITDRRGGEISTTQIDASFHWDFRDVVWYQQHDWMCFRKGYLKSISVANSACTSANKPQVDIYQNCCT